MIVSDAYDSNIFKCIGSNNVLIGSSDVSGVISYLNGGSIVDCISENIFVKANDWNAAGCVTKSFGGFVEKCYNYSVRIFLKLRLISERQNLEEVFI